MSKQVILNIGDGSFDEGFPVFLQVMEGVKQIRTRSVSLPKNPALFSSYEHWKKAYEDLDEVRRIAFPTVEVTNVSSAERRTAFKQATANLKKGMESWLQEASFNWLLTDILNETIKTDDLRVTFQTDRNLNHRPDSLQTKQFSTLLRLPWHLWSLFEERPKAEFLLSFRTDGHDFIGLKHPIKILGVIGARENIDPEVDRSLINELRQKGADVEWLDPATHAGLTNQLWDKHWDILFFAGHSATLEDLRCGEIQLNENEKISLADLKNSFRHAVEQGLKLAIFNSCDGLGMANDLEMAGLPYSIVMREPVTDRVAQTFLKYFLQDFSRGQPLHLAVRRARSRLADVMRHDFPCADWLPIICQHPGAPELVWVPDGQELIPPLSDGSQIEDSQPSSSTAEVFPPEPTPIHPIPPSPDGPQREDSQPSSSTAGDSPPELTPKPFRKILLPVIGVGVIAAFAGTFFFLASTSSTAEDQKIPNFSDYSLSDESDITTLQAAYSRNRSNPRNLIDLLNAITRKQKSVYAIGVVVQKLSLDEQLLRGVAQAQLEQNCPGVEFTQIPESSEEELIEKCSGKENVSFYIEAQEDDANKDRAIEIAQSLADKVVAVVGYSNTPTTFAAYESVHEQKRVPLVAPTSTASRQGKDYLFRTATNDTTAIQNIIEYLRKEVANGSQIAGQKVVIVSQQGEEYSESFVEEVSLALRREGVMVVNPNECKISLDGFDASKCVDSLPKNSEKTVLLLVPGSTTVEGALEVIHATFKENTPNLLHIIGSDTMFDDIYNESYETMPNLSEALRAVDIAVAIPWFESGSNFEQKAEAMWGGSINWRSVTAYDAVTMIAENFRQIKQKEGTDNPTRQEFYEALKSNSVQGATGAIQFQNNDRRENEDFGVIVQLEYEPDKDEFIFQEWK